MSDEFGSLQSRLMALARWDAIENECQKEDSAAWEAADTIARLEAENARLRELLAKTGGVLKLWGPQTDFLEAIKIDTLAAIAAALAAAQPSTGGE